MTRYCFDEFERMVLSRGEGAPKPTAYVYDGLDRRDRSTLKVGADPVPQDYAYIGTSKLLSREKTAAGDVRSYDYDSQGHRLGQSVKDHSAPDSAAPEHRTFATDANGSVEGLENGAGKFGTEGEDTYLYDPYGEDEKVAPEGSDPTDSDAALSRTASENPFRFEGFYFDSGVKSYDMQAREYRPDSGRFLSQDRYESAAADQVLQADPLTQNRYAFAGGNPVNNVEFDGHRLYNPDGGRRAPRQPTRGGGPNGDSSPPSTADGSASRSRPQGRIALPVVPRTTRVADRRALTLSRTHPLQALYADGPSGPPLLQPAAKKLAHAAGSVLNTAGDIANWPFPKTTVGNALHGAGADLQSGDPKRIFIVLAGFTPLGRIGVAAAKTLAPKAVEALRGAFAARMAGSGAEAAAAKVGARLGESPTLEAGGRSFIYGDRVLDRAREVADLNHNFPSSLDREILTHGTRTEVSEGYVEYTLPGKINGRGGTYEIGTRPSGLANGEVIKHRFFNPNRTP